MIPVPLFVALLFVRLGEAPASTRLTTAGLAIVASAETIRLWAVHHIGAVSRTRTDRLGPLVDDGPFGVVRNPLYLGNIALWVGFALIARLVWLAPAIAIVLGLEYHAIVKWEERLLTSRLGDAYRDYTTRVPRWVPNLALMGRKGRDSTRTATLSASANATPYSWRDTLFSERGTLIAVAAGYGLLWIKARF
ncbi:MAG TPA: isoprenylcysteine carboxylmethyltransferase family protein [Vicinamibacterales bacterium]|nr:isoprenylcysteine carboxylmethyltransferase family protein [Vicinamibacterales bacterium]